MIIQVSIQCVSENFCVGSLLHAIDWSLLFNSIRISLYKPISFSLVDRSAASTPPYPVLPNLMTASTDSVRQPQQQGIGRVRVLHAYQAQHDYELTIRPGKIKIITYC